MSEYDLILAPSGVIFMPSDETQEILQNVMTICTTQKYSVPMARELGIEGGFLDEAVGKTRAKLKAELVQAVRKYEPRARVSRIDFEPGLNGQVNIRLKVKILDYL